jgi:hypothetical protein
VLLFVIIPFFDRNPSRKRQDRRLAINLGAAVLVVTLILGAMGHFSDGDIKIFGKTYHITAVGLPVAAEGDAHE